MIFISNYELLWRRQWHPTPILLPGKSHGQRRLVGYNLWSREESDTTEWLHFHFLLSCIGEGNGHPLQCSCLENPMDREAWWAAVHGVAQSWTQLKWLSSSIYYYCYAIIITMISYRWSLKFWTSLNYNSVVEVDFRLSILWLQNQCFSLISLSFGLIAHRYC